MRQIGPGLCLLAHTSMRCDAMQCNAMQDCVNPAAFKDGIADIVKSATDVSEQADECCIATP